MKELVCPLCQLALIANHSGLNCANQHQFDRSRQGYFNLLPAQHKNSKQPGESKEQMQARRTFLSADHFLPLAEKIKSSIPHTVKSFVDLGCGEGYFTFKLARHFSNATGYAVDISKAAIQLVAKSAPNQITPIVASSFHLPFANESVDLVTRILAPSFDEEVLRVLDANGLFLVVRPQGDHLVTLRQRIYSELKPYQTPKVPEGFVVQHESSLRFNLDINDPLEAKCLLQMTPFSWRLKPEMLESLCEEGWHDLAEFNITIYQKRL